MGNGPAMSRALEARLEQISKPAMKRALVRVAGEALLTKTQERFSIQRDPYGRFWKRSARARAQGGQTLSDNGTLRRSFNNLMLNDSTGSVGTPVRYANVHQTGKIIRPKRAKHLAFKVGKRQVFAKQVRIPRRMMLPDARLGSPPEYTREVYASLAAYLKVRLTP
jgi:phage virion morphogenesis protein